VASDGAWGLQGILQQEDSGGQLFCCAPVGGDRCAVVRGILSGCQQQQEQAVVCEVQHDEGTLQVSRTGIGLLRVSARDTVAGGQLVF
jgi:hypothetical protein